MSKLSVHSDRLKQHLVTLGELQRDGINANAPEFKGWKQSVHHSLLMLSSHSLYALRFTRLSFRIPRPQVYTGRARMAPESYWGDEDQKAFDRDISLAKMIIGEAIEEADDAAASDTPVEGPTRTVVSAKDGTIADMSVFLVHGHDDGAKQTVARFLERLKLTPIVLHEKPNEGRTLIEKLERYSGTAFAVVLLTPDDSGAAKAAPQDIADRARQNVVLELGYFIGKLGRSRVCALYRGPLELPSDMDGIVYVDMDPRGAWRAELARELRSAGIAVDATALLS